MSRIPSLGPRGEGWVALQVVLFVLIGLGDRLDPAPMATDPATADAARVAGLGVMAVAALVVVLGLALLSGSNALTAVPRPTDSASLVEAGPYRWVRHPIYAGLVLGGIGLAVLRLSWATLVFTVALFVVLDLKRRREEAWLHERYPGYAAYQRRTKALVPFLY
jgi:protein-S-isoprenylcysteine O-methyltransferase Ste14